MFCFFKSVLNFSILVCPVAWQILNRFTFFFFFFQIFNTINMSSLKLHEYKMLFKIDIDRVYWSQKYFMSSIHDLVKHTHFENQTCRYKVVFNWAEFVQTHLLKNGKKLTYFTSHKCLFLYEFSLFGSPAPTKQLYIKSIYALNFLFWHNVTKQVSLIHLTLILRSIFQWLYLISWFWCQ